MNMISHQAIGVQDKAADLLAIGEALKILLTVLVILEDDLAVNPSEHNMKDTAFALFSGSSWHIAYPQHHYSAGGMLCQDKRTVPLSPLSPPCLRAYFQRKKIYPASDCMAE